jgi:hypothetical protein
VRAVTLVLGFLTTTTLLVSFVVGYATSAIVVWEHLKTNCHAYCEQSNTYQSSDTPMPELDKPGKIGAPQK